MTKVSLSRRTHESVDHISSVRHKEGVFIAMNPWLASVQSSSSSQQRELRCDEGDTRRDKVVELLMMYGKLLIFLPFSLIFTQFH